MSMPNAIIAEDEAVLRGELRARLAELWPELVISAEASDGPVRPGLSTRMRRTSCFSTSRCLG